MNQTGLVPAGINIQSEEQQAQHMSRDFLAIDSLQQLTQLFQMELLIPSVVMSLSIQELNWNLDTVKVQSTFIKAASLITVQNYEILK